MKEIRIIQGDRSPNGEREAPGRTERLRKALVTRAAAAMRLCMSFRDRSGTIWHRLIKKLAPSGRLNLGLVHPKESIGSLRVIWQDKRRLLLRIAEKRMRRELSEKEILTLVRYPA